MTKKSDRVIRIQDAEELVRDFIEAEISRADADDFYFLNQTEEWSHDLRASQRALPDAGDAALLGGNAEAAWDEDEIGNEGVGGSILEPDQDLTEQMNEVFELTYEDNGLFWLVERSEWRDAHHWN